VLLNEVLDLLGVKAGGIYVDGTVGSAGHAMAILERIGPHGFLLGIDRDEEAVARARDRLGSGRSVADMGVGGRQGRCCLVHGNFADMASMAGSQGISHVDGVLLDLGVSSEQLECGDRGFSFRNDGPLDMRMDRGQRLTAADLVNGLSEDGLSVLIRDFGEERWARRIARAVVEERARAPITTTRQLAEIIRRAVGGGRGRIHPATRTFQALRIKVNDELEHVRKGLAAGLNLLAVGGRVAVITFHSLEDRIAKEFFVEHAGRWESLASGGREWRGATPAVSFVTRKPVRPSEEEATVNPRARSAKLRVVERVREAGGDRHERRRKVEKWRVETEKE
jgi:16S rRNA (cytosine1402-N4)-methyltransferase